MSISSSFPELSCERLLLRKISMKDAPQVFILRSDLKINQFIKRAPQQTILEAQQWIANNLTGFENQKWINWVLSTQDDGQMMGSICLWNFSEDRKTAEIGYDLLPQFWKKGYMNEAMTKIVSYGFNALNLDRIEAFTHFGNGNSIGLLEKNKFKLDPQRRDPGVPHNRIYCLNRNQWEANLVE